ncbi:hypothetical protein UVI_02000770 [Ustilaginoidea virens]|uniref:Uncharacterized protein n=1 Tax=Ustilaginoidea virens TaxID=1159556 RepID=A0A1B5L228_USTVR|nr:hypothetical protein UVI_02000770 [Ustilaginoidea virens]
MCGIEANAGAEHQPRFFGQLERGEAEMREPVTNDNDGQKRALGTVWYFLMRQMYFDGDVDGFCAGLKQ